ncbi:HNH endonuclease [Methylobacterium gnaphalii]|nr:HNH endonuclease [Methylobacterium gnaphalii]
MCLADGITCAATTADHVVPHRGDVEAFWSNELQSLCNACHNSVKQREEQSTLHRGRGV